MLRSCVDLNRVDTADSQPAVPLQLDPEDAMRGGEAPLVPGLMEDVDASLQQGDQHDGISEKKDNVLDVTVR